MQLPPPRCRIVLPVARYAPFIVELQIRTARSKTSIMPSECFWPLLSFGMLLSLQVACKTIGSNL